MGRSFLAFFFVGQLAPEKLTTTHKPPIKEQNGRQIRSGLDRRLDGKGAKLHPHLGWY